MRSAKDCCSTCACKRASVPGISSLDPRLDNPHEGSHRDQGLRHESGPAEVLLPEHRLLIVTGAGLVHSSRSPRAKLAGTATSMHHCLRRKVSPTSSIPPSRPNSRFTSLPRAEWYPALPLPSPTMGARIPASQRCSSYGWPGAGCMRWCAGANGYDRWMRVSQCNERWRTWEGSRARLQR